MGLGGNVIEWEETTFDLLNNCHLALETVQPVGASNGTIFHCGSIQRFTGTV